MADERAPVQVRQLARERATARQARNWAEADRLRGEIEAAGWTIVDDGLNYSLRPSHPPDDVDGPAVRYGRSDNVPSVLDEPVAGPLSVVLVVTGPPEDTDRAVAAVRRSSVPGVQVILVGDGIDIEIGEADEVVATAAPLGYAAALNCGIRRARSEIVAVLDPSVEPLADLVEPLAAALADPTVAVSGPFGIVSDDMRQFRAAPAGDVDAIEGYLIGFRRADYVTRGPLDERFRFYRNLDIWWSLVLRDEGAGLRPRRALALDGPTVVRHEHRGWTALGSDERDRLSRRNFYRVLDRFRERSDLLVANPGPGLIA